MVEEPAAEEPIEGEETTQEAELAADAVIVATSEHGARELLAGAVPALAAADAAPAPEIEIISLLLDAPALRTPPRGTGVLTVPHSHTAKALTHSTAKWSWVREAAGDREVVRVSFGAQGNLRPPRRWMTGPRSTSPAGRPGAPGRPAVARPGRGGSSWALRAGATRVDHRLGERRAAARQAVQAVPGLAAVGAWLAGTGLAQVVPDAAEEADRLRRALLWD